MLTMASFIHLIYGAGRTESTHEVTTPERGRTIRAVSATNHGPVRYKPAANRLSSKELKGGAT